MLLLISAMIFYLTSAVIASLALFYEPQVALRQEYEENQWDTIVNIIIISLQAIKIIVLCCMNSCIEFNIAFGIFLLEAVVALGLAISTFNAESILSAPMMSLGLTFMLFVWPLLSKHMNFIAHHVTEKEFHARLETMNRLQVDDAMLKSVSCSQKCSNVCRLFCRRKIPDSEIL